MSKPSWESHMEVAGIEVTDEHRKLVAQMSTAGMPNAGYALAEVLKPPPKPAADAAKIMRGFRATLKRTKKTIRNFTRACRVIQSNHQGKRKQGMRNPYGTRW